jgi:thiamine-phosphate pyrophosphorylase
VNARALPRPCLMVVTDRTLCGGATGLVQAVSRAVAGGANVVQVREKDLPPWEQVELVRSIRSACGDRALVVLNGAPAVALGAGAGGVHLPEEGLGVSDARRALRGRLLVGRSVHSRASAIQAAAEGADYLVLGTVFPSRSHPGGATGGIELVREVYAAVRCPVLAIGGISAENAASVMAAGAAGVAVISSVLGAQDPEQAAAQLWSVLHVANRDPVAGGI